MTKIITLFLISNRVAEYHSTILRFQTTRVNILFYKQLSSEIQMETEKYMRLMVNLQNENNNIRKRNLDRSIRV